MSLTTARAGRSGSSNGPREAAAAWRGGVWGAVAVACVMAPGTAFAQPGTVDFTISGTSTIRGWTCTAKGTVQTTPGAAGALAAPGFPTGVQRATVTVPHKAFACPNPEMLEHLHQAMQSDKFSEIVFTLEKYEAMGSQFQASGQMKILAATQPFSVPIALTATPAGVEVSGNTRLDMTTYGVTPPTVMLGMLRVGPQIRIEFKGLVPAAK